jgi:hypothetical protein
MGAVDPDLEAVGRFVRSCSMLEIALFQALTSLDPIVTFAEAEWQFRPSGCIRWLRSTAADLTRARVANSRDCLTRRTITSTYTSVWSTVETAAGP